MTRAALTAVLVAAVVSLGTPACTMDREPDPPPHAPSTVVSVPSSVQRIPGQPPVVHYGTVPDAVVGVAYEYHLFVHCGIRVADFAGRSWEVDPAAGVPSFDAPAGPDPNYLVGSMMLLSADRAAFDWSGRRAEFVPARAPLPVCA